MVPYSRTYGAQNEVVCRDNGRFGVRDVSGEARGSGVNFLELIRCVRYGTALRNQCHSFVRTGRGQGEYDD